MARYKIDYLKSEGRSTENVEAAIDLVEGDFISFYSEASQSMLGQPMGAGDVVKRVRSSIVAAITRLED